MLHPRKQVIAQTIQQGFTTVEDVRHELRADTSIRIGVLAFGVEDPTLRDLFNDWSKDALIDGNVSQIREQIAIVAQSDCLSRNDEHTLDILFELCLSLDVDIRRALTPVTV